MLAILEDAVGCFQQNAFATKPARQRLFIEAQMWLMSEADGPYSFKHICSILGLEAPYLRRGLWQWWDTRLGERRAQECEAAPRRSVAVNG